ncbi:hypothetical protein Tco_0092728 [Tanacetum coccineum]
MKALIKNFDDVKARIEADRILAEKLQEQEREQLSIEKRAKFLHDTIAAQRKFLAQQRSQALRNKPPTKNQLRNQMMTYIKHVGNYKHADLKSKKFEDIQALYEIEDKEEESTRKRKLGTRKKMKSRKRRYIQHTSEDVVTKINDDLREASSSAASVKLIDLPSSKVTSGSGMILSAAEIVTFFLTTLLLAVSFLMVQILILEVGERVVLREEVIDDDLGESGEWHIFTEVYTFNSWIDIKNFPKDFSIDNALLVGQEEFIRFKVFDLLDCVPELLHKDFRDIYRDSECFEARIGAVDGLDGTGHGYQRLSVSAYDFFVPGPLPMYAGNPNNNNGWIEADVPLLGKLGAEADEPMVGPVVDEIAETIVEMEEQVIALVIDMEEDIAMLFGDDDFSDADSEGFEDEEEVWEVNEEWLMAPVTPPPIRVVASSSTYEVGGPSTAAAEGQPFTLPAPGFPVPSSVIEDLCTRMGHLEYGHGQLVKKGFYCRGTYAGYGIPNGSGRGQIGAGRYSGGAGLADYDPKGNRESTLMQCILGMDRRLADLERRPPVPQ